MKKFILSFVILLLVTTLTNAQLTANAGPDQTVCAGTSFVIGGNPTATGGTPPYTYSWSPSTGLNNAQVANPTALLYSNINYTVIVTDSLGAHDTAYAAITVLSKPSPYILVNDTSVCTQEAVSLSVQVQSGTPPFTYAWDFGNGGTSNVISPITTYPAPGNYQVSVTVTDSNNCTGTNILYENVHQLIVSTNATNVTCFGGSNGAIIVSVTGGFPPFAYTWNNGMTTQNAFNMPAGSYNVTITDSHGCVGFGGATLTEPVPIAVATTVTNESIAGACDGSISANATGGVGAYTYNWSNTGGGQIALNLCHGTYYVTVTDANACTATAVAVVGSGSCSVNTLVVSIQSQDLSCAHQVDTMTVNVSGGTPPYSYNWNTGSVTDTIITNVEGLYLVYVSDDSGCVKSAIDTLMNNGVNISLQTVTPVSCNGTSNGYIKVNVTGGAPPYTYLWNTGETGDTLANIASGYYSLTVTDTQSCIDTFGYYLPQTSTNWSYYVYTSSTSANCGTNGTATAWVYGGTSPFTFVWNNADTTAVITGLASGNYTVTVTGSDGCMRIGSTSVNSVCYNIVEGFVFNDVNHNCVRDSGEAGSHGISVMATGTGGNYYGYTDNSGYYHIDIPTSGNFTITASAVGGSNNCSMITVCGAQTASFSGVGDSVMLDFGISSTTGFDLALHPGWHAANPGFSKDYWVLYFQQSVPIYSGPAIITFKYDSMLVFNSCNNSGVNNPIAHTITWNVSSVPYPSWDWNTVPRAYFTVPANIPTGYQLSQEFWITPVVGDCDTADNHLHVIQPVTGSRDPNEKVVSPEGDILEDDSVLTYTIHFQNTGDDTTWFITVKDTLSSFLNPATVVNVASSHEYSSFDISGTGILTWLFNPIFLVDSFTNEPASKGFVMFRVKKKSNLPLNTKIENQAHIYFDYNEPVATNTVINTLTEPNYIFNVTNDAGIQVTAAPNPFSKQTQITVEGITGAFNFELFDVSGKLLQKKSALISNRFVINREDMSAGIYFYSITTNTMQKAFGRLVVE